MVTNDSVVTAIIAIQTLIKNSGDKIVESTSKYGPEVINIAENYIRLIAIISTIPYLIVAIISTLIIKNSYKVLRKSSSIYDKSEDSSIQHRESNKSLVSILIIIVFVILLIISVYNIIKLDNVLSILYPKMELIKLAKDSIVNNIAAK